MVKRFYLVIVLVLSLLVLRLPLLSASTPALVVFSNEFLPETEKTMEAFSVKGVELLSLPDWDTQYYQKVQLQEGMQQLLKKLTSSMDVKLDLMVIKWDENSKANFMKIMKYLKEKGRPYIIQVPSTWRLDADRYLNELSQEMIDLVGQMAGLSNFPLTTELDLDASKKLIPWLFDPRFIVLHDAKEHNGDGPHISFITPKKFLDIVRSKNDFQWSCFPEGVNLVHATFSFFDWEMLAFLSLMRDATQR